MIKILSAREKEVLRHVIEGSTNQKIAKNLEISLDTAKTHVSHILRKLEAKNRVEAAVKGLSLLEL